jgi:hypothetical protein
LDIDVVSLRIGGPCRSRKGKESRKKAAKPDGTRCEEHSKAEQKNHARKQLAAPAPPVKTGWGRGFFPPFVRLRTNT